MNRNTRAAILSCLKPTSTAWHCPDCLTALAVQPPGSAARVHTAWHFAHSLPQDTCAHHQEARCQILADPEEKLYPEESSKTCAAPLWAVIWVQCEYAPPTNQSTHYVTRAQLVCHQNHLLLLIVFLASRGPVFVLPACSYLLRPVSTWVSLAQLTVQPRKLGNKDFFGFSAFQVILLAAHLVKLLPKLSLIILKTFYTEHSVNYRSSFVQRNLKSCSN